MIEAATLAKSTQVRIDVDKDSIGSPDSADFVQSTFSHLKLILIPRCKLCITAHSKTFCQTILQPIVPYCGLQKDACIFCQAGVAVCRENKKATLSACCQAATKTINP